MTAPRLYLDWNASAPLRAEARAAMAAAMDVAGNPSSVHAEGRAARALVEKARAQVAAAVGCKPGEVIFTSGATEAAAVLARLAGPVEVDPTAHDCLWAHRRPGEGRGILAWGHANNETGIVAEPPADGRPVLLDIVQTVGRVPFSFAWSGAEMAIVSAHKFGGPKGVGALIVRDGVEVPAGPAGGGQELGRRAGTENVIGIAGMGAAAEAAARDLADGVWEGVRAVRDAFEAALEAGQTGTTIVGRGGVRLPNTTCMVTPGWKGETQVMLMDLAGYAVSAGAACSSGKVRASRVLAAMGFDATEAASALRVSIGPGTGREEMLRFAEAWTAAARRRTAKAA
ncbi:MAG: aminotransferase class V-fold PLP-dependent enzyme [Rhodobacteraceae bacterium]|nr:aminotransferase class V-fold PLP-dependent enzyme [Paracoccaceae bacterium]